MVGIELQMISPTLFFRYLIGLCHGNQFYGKIVAKLATPSTYRSVIPKRNGILLPQCARCIISVNDASISCEYFVKFSSVTPESTELICERQVRHGQNIGAFSQISPDTLDRFLQSFQHTKALYV